MAHDPFRFGPTDPPRYRAVYVALGLALGWAGVHNVYAWRWWPGLVQLGLGAFVLLAALALALESHAAGALVVLAAPLSLWLAVSVVRDLVFVRRDGGGRPMR